MLELELLIPVNARGEAVVKVVEQVGTANGLTCALKGTLSSYPGCIHWHYKKANQRGTLEITWWEAENHLWFKVAKGRMGKWIDEALPELKKQIEISLNQDPADF